MKPRFAAIALACLLGGGVAAMPGCAQPYSGKAEKIKRPRAKPRPAPAADAAAAAPAFDEKCRTNFFDEPGQKPKKRKPRDAKGLVAEANGLLLEAEDKDGAARLQGIKDAMTKLRNALDKDPYGPEATYQLAVAYAMVNKKGCAVELLKRLKELGKFAEVEAETDRTIKRVLGDPAFDPFRKDANAAVGQ
jgi:hypothetical protein